MIFSKSRLSALFALTCVMLVTITSCQSVKKNAGNRKVKNIILMIGDGMGPAYMKAYREYRDDPSTLAIEQTGFDKILLGTIDTSPLNKDGENGRITDSAASATAYATGQKVYSRSLSITAEGKKIKTVLQQAKENGMSTGIIATSLLTDATPAAFVTHSASRYSYDKIADQYVDNQDKKGLPFFDVILSGGKKYFQREDRDLIQELREKGFHSIENREELLNNNHSKIVGLFAPKQIRKNWDKKKETPSLAEMTSAAIKLLSKNENGFFLMVEASQIDWAGHRNNIVGILSEMQGFELALNEALKFAKEDGQTQLILTADHETGGLSLGTRFDDKNKYYWKSQLVKTFQHTPEEIIRRAQESNDLLAEFKKSSSLKITNEEEERLRNFSFIAESTKEPMKELKEETIANVQEMKKKNTNKKINQAVGLITSIVDRHTNTGWTTKSHTSVDVNLYGYGPQSDDLRGHFDNTRIGQFIFQLLEKQAANDSSN